jgi:hypothetical protein
MRNHFILVTLATALSCALLGAEDTKPPTFKVPKGWVSAGADKLGIATAKFTSGKGDKEIGVVLLKAGGGLEANVNRWRAQVGLKPLEKDELPKVLQPIKVDGHTAHVLDVKGRQTGGDGMVRIIGVVIECGNEMWFVKLSGTPEAVEEHKAAFEEFVKSIRFEK